MTWTTDKPTKMGWYWWREKYVGGKNPKYLVRVLEVENIDGVLGIRGYNKIRLMHGHWAGPLEPPEEEGG